MQYQADKQLQKIMQQFTMMIMKAHQLISTKESFFSDGCTLAQVPSFALKEVVSSQVNTVFTAQVQLPFNEIPFLLTAHCIILPTSSES